MSPCRRYRLITAITDVAEPSEISRPEIATLSRYSRSGKHHEPHRRLAPLCVDRRHKIGVRSKRVCAIAGKPRSGLNTEPGPHVRPNTGSPTLSGGPRNKKPCRRLAGVGNTWGVVTSVPACSTVPAAADGGTRSMALSKWLPARWRREAETLQRDSEPPISAELDALVRAQGECLAFLATILERERVVASGDLARMLAEFASISAAERPAEARILSLWATYLQDASASLRDASVLH